YERSPSVVRRVTCWPTLSPYFRRDPFSNRISPGWGAAPSTRRTRSSVSALAKSATPWMDRFSSRSLPGGVQRVVPPTRPSTVCTFSMARTASRGPAAIGVVSTVRSGGFESAYLSAAPRANWSPRRLIALTPNTATATLTTTRPVRSLRARRSPHAFLRIIGSTVPKPTARALAIRALGGNPRHRSLVEVLGRGDAALRVGVVGDQGQRLATALRRVGGRVGVERGLSPGQPGGE